MMKVFGYDDLMSALDHAEHGGQSLYLASMILDRGWNHDVIVNALAATQRTALLYDMDTTRLLEWMRDLGTIDALICYRGKVFQHTHLTTCQAVTALLCNCTIHAPTCDYTEYDRIDDGNDDHLPAS